MNKTLAVQELHHYIDGKDHAGSGSRYLDIYNPALGQPIRKIRAATRQDVDQAVAAAKKALPSWQALTVAKRVQFMAKYLAALEKDLATFAAITAEEHGKTIADAEGSIARGLEVLEFCLSATNFLKSDFSANVSNAIDTFNLRQPLGVCAGITPFNFPAMVPLWMYPIALVCGNTFVLKPSEKVPSAALYQAKKLAEIGLPPGVLNVVVGDKEAVDSILENPDIAAISFVGSTAVGEYVYQKGTANNKKVQAMCGAKNHLVVMPDADEDQVVDALIGSAYGSAGERCMAISVAVVVGKETADRLVEKLIPKVKGLKLGPCTLQNAEMGPVISKEALAKISGFIERGEATGAKLLVDGRKHKVQGHEDGYFLGGSLFDFVRPEMEIYQKEIFGPVLSVVRVESYDQALKLVNDHEYGNGVSIFTRDGYYARHFSMHANIGMVGVNIPIPVPVAYHSFGGWKRSSFGGQGIYGMEGVRFYTKLKTITQRWPVDKGNAPQFHFVRGSEQ